MSPTVSMLPRVRLLQLPNAAPPAAMPAMQAKPGNLESSSQLQAALAIHVSL